MAHLPKQTLEFESSPKIKKKKIKKIHSHLKLLLVSGCFANYLTLMVKPSCYLFFASSNKFLKSNHCHTLIKKHDSRLYH